jgi:uncharacterized Zn-binding protein involved in type VI secretion
MGNNFPTQKGRRPLLVWQQTSSHGRPTLKKGGNFTLPQQDTQEFPIQPGPSRVSIGG